MDSSILPAGVVRYGDSDEETLCYRVDPDVYSLESLFRACYVFTDRCFLFLQHADDGAIAVEFRRRPGSAGLLDVVGAFANELISQRVRADLALETRAIREMIVAQAFGDADFAEHEP